MTKPILDKKTNDELEKQIEEVVFISCGHQCDIYPPKCYPERFKKYKKEKARLLEMIATKKQQWQKSNFTLEDVEEILGEFEELGKNIGEKVVLEFYNEKEIDKSLLWVQRNSRDNLKREQRQRLSKKLESYE